MLHAIGDELFVGVGSDHTDRKAETINVSLSKQMCAKPVSREDLEACRMSRRIGTS